MYFLFSPNVIYQESCRNSQKLSCKEYLDTYLKGIFNTKIEYNDVILLHTCTFLSIFNTVQFMSSLKSSDKLFCFHCLLIWNTFVYRFCIVKLIALCPLLIYLTIKLLKILQYCNFKILAFVQHRQII